MSSSARPTNPLPCLRGIFSLCVTLALRGLDLLARGCHPNPNIGISPGEAARMHRQMLEDLSYLYGWTMADVGAG